MLIHCRLAHLDELDNFGAQKELLTKKDALTQQDISKLLKKSPVLLYSAAKQKELNRAVAYNTVIHDKLQLSRFDSVGFRR
jgi:hypothetical protein